MATNPIGSTSTSTSSIGSGLDVNSIVSALMAVEQIPLTKLNAKIATDQTQLSLFGGVTNLVSSFQTAVRGLTTAGSFQAFDATPADTSVLTASATSTAAVGNYSIGVTSLAQSQQLIAAGQASSSATIGSGATTTLSFDFGTISGGALSGGTYTGATFASNGGGVKTVTIDSTNNTLQGMRDAINNANIGVSASIINDGGTTPYRLAITSTASGSNNSLSIGVSGDSAISSLLAYNPAGTQNLSQTVTAQNANFTVNGVAITKPSNTITDAIQGVTLNLNKVTTSPTSLAVTQNTSGITAAASAFVTAYNNLYSNLKSETAYDATTQTAGPLQGDSAVRQMMTDMRGMLSSVVSGGTLTSLSQVGITTQAGGTLAIDTTKFSAAVANNVSDVTNLFTSANGFATQFNLWATNTLGTTLTSRTDGINKTITDLNNQVVTMQKRLAGIQTRLQTQFTSLDTLLSSMNNTQSYLTRQLG